MNFREVMPHSPAVQSSSSAATGRMRWEILLHSPLSLSTSIWLNIVDLSDMTNFSFTWVYTMSSTALRLVVGAISSRESIYSKDQETFL